MNYTDYTLKVLREKIKDPAVLCIGFGNNPYFKHDSSKKYKNDQIYMLDDNKTIIVTDKMIADIEYDSIPIFMSRVFEHFRDYSKTISKISSITDKFYLVVPDMNRVYNEHLTRNFEIVKEINSPCQRFERDTIEILSACEEEYPNELHSIWTDKNSMQILLPGPWFTIYETSEIDDINGYPHLFLEVEVNKEITYDEACNLFDSHKGRFGINDYVWDVKNNIKQETTLVDENNNECWNIENTGNVSCDGSLLVLENYFSNLNTYAFDYTVYTLSSTIQEGGIVCVIENNCDIVINKLCEMTYNTSSGFFNINNLLFGNNNSNDYIQRKGWTSPKFMKITFEWEKLFREISIDDVIDEDQKMSIKNLQGSLENYQFMKLFERV